MIEPINSFKEASTAKKAAVIGGVAAGAAAVGTLAYAVKNGKVDGKSIGDVFKKAEEGAEKIGLGTKLKKSASAIGDGYKKLGGAIRTKATGAWDTIKEKVGKLFKKGAEEAPKA